MNTVETRGLYRTFGEGELVVHAIQGVNLDIAEGEFVCLAGPSGSGKTTLLNMIGGLDKPSKGTLRVVGNDLSRMNKNQLADMRLHKIGFVFQSYNLVPVLSAVENVEFVAQLQGVAASERRDMAMSILKEVGLEGLEHRRPAELSGGQQQRVAVARAIVTRPALVLADEPTANLDSVASEKLIELFLELNEHFGTTFISSTHDPMVMERARRLIRLKDGMINEDIHQGARQ